MNRVSLIALTAMLSCASFAWDVEHDELAQLVGETLPKEIKEFYTFDDFGTLMAYCHFPDMTDFEPRRFHALDDIEEIKREYDKGDEAQLKTREDYLAWCRVQIAIKEGEVL